MRTQIPAKAAKSATVQTQAQHSDKLPRAAQPVADVWPATTAFGQYRYTGHLLQRRQAQTGQEGQEGQGGPEASGNPAPANRTGLPDQLKSGIESLSGLSMDKVKVHYNSAKPARLNALAYAQGSDIHLAPGQEQHLPHEAWHVVQQVQGRVKPTMQMKVGVRVNDDADLEAEADLMGQRALAQTTGLAKQPVPDSEQVGSSLVHQRMALEMPGAGSVIQLGRHKNGAAGKKKKKKKPANTRYGGCTFEKDPLTVKNALFFDRPPSNSRRGQGDHVISYSLITQAVATSVNGKSLDQAGGDLAELVKASKEFVSSGAINQWWHTNADKLINSLESIDQDNEEIAAKWAIQSGINDSLALLNMMPGTAMKNNKSTKGHGEGGSKGGLAQAERDVKKGKTLNGNVWVNVLNLFDGAADKTIMESPSKLEAKIEWLMALFARAAPTLFNLIENDDLTLMPDTDLTSAVTDKFGTLTGLEVAMIIESWIED